MRGPAAAIHELAALLGIEPEYHDNWGTRHETTIEVKRALLRAMGVEDVGAELLRLKRHPWGRLIAPVQVVSVNEQPVSLPVYFPLPQGEEAHVVLTVRFQDEDGTREERVLSGVQPAAERDIAGKRYVRVDIPNRPDRSLGYHAVEVACQTSRGNHSGRMRLIVCPDRCHAPAGRTWGLSVNLYAMRSDRDWGVGDLGILKGLMCWVGNDLGGGFVGINPLHAIPNRMPFGISPYASTSRLYRNHLYLDMERVLESSSQGRAFMKDPAVQSEINRLRRDVLIDYEGAAALKLRALRVAFEEFMDGSENGEMEAFHRYVREQGSFLLNHATFMALEEHLRSHNPTLYRWQDWPLEYRDSRGQAVSAFQESSQRNILFFQYVQWLLERQVEEATEGSIGMTVGLYNDLAVGSAEEGSDAWSFPAVFAMGVHAGAPPDAFSLNGQDWGFPPFVPQRLEESGYELFVQTIRHNVEHAGALRIDHALGLFRLFWIPEGMSPREGAYVRYPAEDLLRIIALESVRNRAVIIAEDLGTVGAEVRDTLSRFGMLTYRLFYFERDWNTGRFLSPAEYPELALTAVTTHDLPTLSGYWQGRDIDVKAGLSMYPDTRTAARDRDSRSADRTRMLEALRQHSDIPGVVHSQDSEGVNSPFLLAVYRHLARSPSALVAVSLDDALGVIDQQNMPGTIDTHPNWRQKSPVHLGSLFRNPEVKALAHMFTNERRGGTVPSTDR